MKTKVLNKFKDAQIEIWKQEKALHAETQNVLFDLLSSMSKKEIEEAITITEYDEPVKKNIDDLTQPQQKVIIDSILLNVFKI